MPFSYPYPRPAVTVDMAVVTVAHEALQILLIKRKAKPYKGRWALPGGFVDVGDNDRGESIDEAAHAS